ncbi:TPA: transcriptional regulator [Candidatus Sumerlaeota bacterium]|nr:transcriptional regulator [Candidatus Sumerlaeota bacterium]
MLTPSLDALDRRLLDEYQTAFPLVERPYAELATRLSCTEGEVLRRTASLRASGLIRRISAIFDSNALGYQGVLLAFEIPPGRLESVAQKIAQHPGITHHYQRDHTFNLWSTLTVSPDANLKNTAEELAQSVHPTRWLFLSAIRVFKIGVNFQMGKVAPIQTQPDRLPHATYKNLTNLEQEAVRLLQTDLSIIAEPFRALIEDAASKNFTPQTLLDRAHTFLDNRIMRRYAAVLGHQAAGYTHNLLTAWKVPESQAEEIGQRMAAVTGVSHCYQRVPYPPDWPYTHFAMLHARTENAATKIVQEILNTTNIHDHAILKTLREFKKTRMLYFANVDAIF